MIIHNSDAYISNIFTNNISGILREIFTKEIKDLIIYAEDWSRKKTKKMGCMSIKSCLSSH